jgi:predicted secreted protein
MGQITGKDVTLQIRVQGSTGAYADVICETTSSFSGSASVTTAVTKCNTVSTVSSPTVTFSVEGVAENAPMDGQVSIEQLLSWFQTNALLDIKYENPESNGTNFYIQGFGYITEFGITAPAEGAVTFTASFQLTGSIDIIP